MSRSVDNDHGPQTLSQGECLLDHLRGISLQEPVPVRANMRVLGPVDFRLFRRRTFPKKRIRPRPIISVRRVGDAVKREKHVRQFWGRKNRFRIFFHFPRASIELKLHLLGVRGHSKWILVPTGESNQAKWFWLFTFRAASLQ